MNAPRQDDDRQGTSRRGLLGAAAVVLALLFGIAGLQSWRDLSVAQSRSRELENRVVATEGRIDALKERIHLLESDPRALERLARDELGLVKPGELVIVLPNEPVSPAALRTEASPAASTDPSTDPPTRTDPAPPSGDPPAPR